MYNPHKTIEEIEKDRKRFNETSIKFYSYGQYVAMLWCKKHPVKIPKKYKRG